jgi:hypothetical protein
MFIKSIEIQSLTGAKAVEKPDWSLVENELRSLDGCDKDSLILDHNDERSYMGISGGRDNQYVVGGYLEGFGSFIANIGIESTKIVEAVVCGDFIEYTAMNVVDLESAIAMAKVFFNSGELASSFRWEKQRREPDRKAS